MRQLLALWHFIEPRLRPAVLLLFVAMLLTVIFIWYQESSSVELPDPTRPPVPPPPGTAIADTLNALTVAPPEIEKTPLRSLIVSDMFNIREVQEAVLQEKRANEIFARAQELAKQQKYREALQTCDQVLTIRPNHLPARQLKEQMQKKLDSLF